ncbi:MAG: type II toxin-antitoxin system RelE/ParE family toxin [Oscillatoriales cyanobacterium RU_3_3]|nr:type II toxin-antitoxin system RelE/ParE family toxin [Microcoleus sp. SU_5_6]NJL69170.1 type II toxin-antitoxin system RelE/ParE family toxin [Microcoleus sp. SM1_3_4]NJM62734.1 type II toxin-antitoxin system RelE/ParE family toxin [Oscillatoriales cyanobacterium RU_3_3]
MNRYLISQAASQDLQAILDYFLTRNIDAGDRFVREFNRKCKNLTSFPNMGRTYPEIAPELRGIPLDSYIILYKVVGDAITIVRVVSGYQDLSNLGDLS